MVLKAYHVTPSTNRQSILTVGLIPKIGLRSKELGESTPAIYLFSSEAALIDGLGNWLGEYFEDVDLLILEVDIEGFLNHTTVEYEAVIHEVIPSDRIRIIREE